MPTAKEGENELESNKKLMTNLENLLKVSHRKEEKYFNIMIRTWVVFAYVIIMMWIKMA